MNRWLTRPMFHRALTTICVLVFTIVVLPGTGKAQFQGEKFEPLIDTVYVDSLADRAWAYFKTHHYDSLILFADQAVTAATAHNMPRRLLRAQLLLAYGKHNTYQYADALELYSRYVAGCQELSTTYDTSLLMLNLAKCYTHLGRVEDGIRYFDAAYESLDPDDYTENFEYYRGLAWFFHRQKIYDQALEIRHRVLDLSRKAEDATGILTATWDLGTEFNAMGQNDSARYYVALAIPQAVALNDRWMQWLTNACMGIIEFELGNTKAGIDRMKMAEPIGAEFGEDLCCGNGAYMAAALIEEGLNDEALPYITKAVKQLPSIDDIDDKRNVLRALHRSYEALGLHENALSAFKEMALIDETLAQRAYQTQVAALEVRTKTRDLIAKITDQELQLSDRADRIRLFRKITFGMGILISLILLAWFIEYKKRRKKTEAYIKRLEREALFSLVESESGESTDALGVIEQAILQHFTDPSFRISDLAQIAGLSQRNLNRVVRDKSGMTPVQLVRTFRIEKAKSLLVHTTQTVAEIAYETGFTEPSYFTKVFKRTHGCSPTEWRKDAVAAS